MLCVCDPFVEFIEYIDANVNSLVEGIATHIQVCSYACVAMLNTKGEIQHAAW